MIRITPQQFNAAFIAAASVAKDEVFGLFDDKKPYTRLMFDRVLPDVAVRLGISIYNDCYYYLDSIFYTGLDHEHFAPTSYYAKHVSIALEHEHDVHGTAVEMNKLQLFNTPLKVLITYAQTVNERQRYLDRYHRIVREADVFGDFATLRRQLVIFGTSNESTVNWHSFVYESSGFTPLY